MTRTDFASKMGVSGSTLYRRMKGRSRLSLDEANKIVAMLNIKRADILPIFLLNNLQLRKGAGRKMKALTALVVAAVLGTGAYLNQPTTEIISYQKQVEEGDTLWDICKEISKDEVDVRLLVWQAMKDNNIKDAGELKPGTVITVNVERARR
mgnify:CR=1 FL=1